jgi:SAM-dependent methyltransferase
MTEIAMTSERVSVAGAASTAGDYFIFLEHLATYNFARQYTVGKDVFDFGCGTGYGTCNLSEVARSIVGADISAEAIDAARREFLDEKARAHLDYRVIEPIERAPLPFEENTFDTVLSFQVIEHVHDVDRYLREVRRVLRPGGVFVCATPDRRTRLFPRQLPFNRFHLREWEPQAFEKLLDEVFNDTKMFGMTASPHALAGELKRCRVTRTLAYPFTFPGAPERWRQAGLRGMKALRSSSPPPATAGAESPERRFGIDLKDVWIAPDVWPSLNIITVSS